MNGLIKAPETRTAVTNTSGHALGLNITAKAISFDGGASDALIIMLASNQKFLLKRGFSQRNDTPLHITGFQSVTLSATGVPTAYASDSVTFTFGDALPTLGPQDTQWGGLVVDPGHPLPAGPYSIPLDGQALGHGTGILQLAVGAASYLSIPYFLARTALGVVRNGNSGSNGVTAASPQFGAFSIQSVVEKNTPASACTLTIRAEQAQGAASVIISPTISIVLPADNTLVQAIGDGVGGPLTINVWELDATQQIKATDTPILTYTMPNFFPATDFNLYLTNSGTSAGALSVYPRGTMIVGY